MLNKKFGFYATVALAGSVFLAGCGDDAANDGEGGGAAEPEFISVLTGGTTGTYYPLGGAMATIIENETGIDTTAEVSQASAANMTSLADGTGEIAFVQTDTAFYASEGSNMFEGEVIDSVSAIGALYPETIQIVTTEGSGITAFEDLAGKSVSVGAPGSGTYINAEQLLEIHGMTMDDVDAQNLDFGESQESLQSGQIDAAFITAGTPTGAVESLSATSDVNIVPVAADKAAELIEKYPYYAEDVVPSGTYGLTEEVETVSVLAMLVVQNDISEDTVYDITKAIYENTDQIQHAKADFIKAETALDGIGIDIHPGAQRYFDEVNQ
ncbi:TAXI family TRAP transporter solute-binding subunit [Planococcus sp. CP5-4]|uniref:TAXI family TRAP transporter solute-binding subunit n=1 Tax=unclassified Planococcus (in: firmicutes) TaxID=2662419 RepID=UPI001C229971|nr:MULTISPECIES: TAXI family TRAP transporter solute-binding subunit [unclassified Planococcus (in: firmicutes)]MBU9672252.1 TAXI family TRAP transporter solute-binding subunit [Planococcus sp. CP5-4_YE]MBV0907815.1 TAXI family TRAP transporter solute-binding subunit [Planococcus sp. CP5-4_UN]MBW6062982.1 TAXI family TRAP transporter solute-binding subunit [Planococcus sp. CP5-4]